MSFSTLPQELRDEILSFYAHSEDPRKAVKIRLVSWEFNNTISQQLLRKASLTKLSEPITSEGDVAYFQHYGGEILCRKVRHRKAAVEGCVHINFLEELIVHAAKQDSETTGKSWTSLSRERYTKNICNAVGAVGSLDSKDLPYGVVPIQSAKSVSKQQWSIIAAAATGNAQKFMNIVKSIRAVTSAPNSYLPSALIAAVASNQVKITQVILEFVVTRVRGPNDWDNGWDEMRSTASALLDALRLAVRTHKAKISTAILEALNKHRELGQSLRRCTMKPLVLDCIQHGDVQTFFAAIHFKCHGSWPSDDTEYSFKALEAGSIFYAFRSSSKTFLRQLIDAGKLDVNNVGIDNTPLGLALKIRRQDLATVLLERSADIHGRCLHSGRKLTVLQRADLHHHQSDKEFLQKWGAEK